MTEVLRRASPNSCLSGGDFLDDGEIARVVIENLRVIGERGFHVGDVVLGGHVLDDMGEHFAEFLERRFLSHVFEVMSL